MLLHRYQVRGRPARSAATSRSPTSPHPPGIPVRTFSYLEPFLNPLISVGHFTPLSEKPGADQTATRPSLRTKHITMHTLRHTTAMRLLQAGTDVSVIALWLGHQNTASTDRYLHADMTIKQAAIDRTRPPDVKPGTYTPAPDILTWLDTL